MAGGVRAEDLLSREDLAALDAAGPVEIVVGIAALNHRRSGTQVAEGAAKALAGGFPDQKAAVLVADAGSQDGTAEAVQAWREAAGAASARPVHLVRLAGPADWARAIQAILAVARRLEAGGCALVDADLVGLPPDGVDRLLGPVLRGEADYVSPAYTRAAAEGTLTTNVLAPLVRALYGVRIQEVVGGCASLSADLVRRDLEADVWEQDLAAPGIAVWLAAEALASGARVVEAHLGRKRVEPGPAEPDLATTVARAVGPLFARMERDQAVWLETAGSIPAPQVGGPAGALDERREIALERMVRAFRLGLKDLLPVWEQVLTDETLAELYPLGLAEADEFTFPIPLWARVVGDFAVGYHERRLARDHLLRALTPLYLGRVAAYLREARAAPAGRLPDLLETIGRTFEAEVERLKARWR